MLGNPLSISPPVSNRPVSHLHSIGLKDPKGREVISKISRLFLVARKYLFFLSEDYAGKQHDGIPDAFDSCRLEDEAPEPLEPEAL